MRTTFYIHIGVYKTGSKSIQYTLFNNREKLLERGINYLPIEPNHSPMFFSLFSRAPHRDVRNINRRMDTPEKASAYNEAIKQRLKEEFEKNTSPKMVVSAEGLCSIYNAAQQIKELLDPYASDYRIIAYVRDHYDYTSSATLQNLKDGAVLDDPNRKLAVPPYRLWIGKYINVFGRDKVDIRVFDAKRFVGGDLIPDFLTAIGEPRQLADQLEIERANQAVSHEAAMILNEVNRAIPTRIDGQVNRARFPRLDRHLEKIVGEKFSISPARFAEHEASILEDRAWLREMLGEPLFENAKPRPASVSRWSETTVASIKQLVADMVQELRTHQRRKQSLTSRLIPRRWNFLARHANGPSEPPYGPIVVPKGLEWLNDAVNPQTASQSGSESPPPQFDEASIRALAHFIHELAFSIRELTKVGDNNGWVYRLYKIDKADKQKQSA